MPIYEYQCECCENCFEIIVFAGDDDKPACPKCCNTKVKRLMSASNCIGLSSEGGSCSPGAPTGFS